MDYDQINTANVDSDSYSSGTHCDESNLSSHVEMNNQIVKLQFQVEMNEIKTLSATLTQQVIIRPEEGNALRASSSRTRERVDRFHCRKLYDSHLA